MISPHPWRNIFEERHNRAEYFRENVSGCETCWLHWWWVVIDSVIRKWTFSPSSENATSQTPFCCDSFVSTWYEWVKFNTTWVMSERRVSVNEDGPMGAPLVLATGQAEPRITAGTSNNCPSFHWCRFLQSSSRPLMMFSVLFYNFTPWNVDIKPWLANGVTTWSSVRAGFWPELLCPDKDSPEVPHKPHHKNQTSKIHITTSERIILHRKAALVGSFRINIALLPK